MSWRGRKGRFVAAFALVAALVVPAAPARAALPGEPADAWEQVWQWMSEVLESIGLLSDCEHGSHIDPNG
jgi:hypothetical protein